MLKFSIKSRKVNLGNRKGSTLYYASQKPAQRVSLSVISERVQTSTALSKADVRSAIIALTEVIREELQQGRIVELGELGSLRIVAGGKLMDTPQEVTTRTISEPKVRFNPSRELKGSALRVPLSIEREDGTSESTTATSNGKGKGADAQAGTGSTSGGGSGKQTGGASGSGQPGF